MSVLVLVDYHNLPSKLVRHGLVSLWHRLQTTISSQLHDDMRDITLRLYGGWYDEQGLSRDGDRVARSIGAAFPMTVRRPSGLQRIHCELASSLLALREHIFPATVRFRKGLKRATASSSRPADCGHPDQCATLSVLGWINGHCPDAGCQVETITAFHRREQKLVDTLMCCDLVSFSMNPTTAPIFVVSEDDDFVPAMLLARHLGADIVHIRTVKNRRRVYDDLLLQIGVRTLTA